MMGTKGGKKERERAKSCRKKKNDIEKKGRQNIHIAAAVFLSLSLSVVWKDWKWKFRDGIAGFL